MEAKVSSQTKTPVEASAGAQPATNDAGKRRSWETIVWLVAAFFFATTTAVSWLRWANFQYRTFDLAYYVQAVWQLIHGRLAVSVENVPLLGNHVEPIVFLFVPLFAIVRHPMLFVVVQNALLASMAPIGYRLARRSFDRRNAALLSIALLIAPAAGYIALHEFHPEALVSPFLLLMVYSRTVRRFWVHSVCFVAVLFCKENMALVLAAYCMVFLIIERRCRTAELIRWYGAPLLVALFWFVLCTKVITPAFNSGNIDYLSLYDRLGKSASEILWNAVTKPQLIAGALAQSLFRGNLVWGLLIPFLVLPLLRPRWLLIAAPVLLQHLLSWRSSEWNIYFHYAAPLLPLFWMGAVEAVAFLRDRRLVPAGFIRTTPLFLIVGCLAAQFLIGPAASMEAELLDQSNIRAQRLRKEAFIARIPADVSVAAPLPYLSHLAMREKLYSLHYILKGLKTLSRERYEPPAPTDIVFIDYDDSATFDAIAGYYHPTMQTTGGAIVPSSDQLLHDFLKRAVWQVQAENELALFRSRAGDEIAAAGAPNGPPVFTVGSDTQLWSEHASGLIISQAQPLEIELRWSFLTNDRPVYPWMLLRLTAAGRSVFITKGLCAPEALAGAHSELWRVTDTAGLPPGDYNAEAIFLDNTKRAWLEAHGGGDWRSAVLGAPVPLGILTVPRGSR